MSIKGQCSSCGWTTKRQLKNMERPCPKCGGAVYVHEEDRGAAVAILVLTIVGMIIIMILFTSLGIGTK